MFSRKTKTDVRGVYGIALMILAIGSKIRLKYSLDTNSLARKVYKDSVFYFVLNFRAFVCLSTPLVPSLDPQLN